MKFFPIASLACVLATPVLLFVTVLAAGGGHGSYWLAKLLFPWTMAATAFTREIAQPFVAVAVAQYPVYGIVLDWVRSAGQLKSGMLALAGAHLAAVILAFAIANPSFTP